jgi:hypothetical protein
MILDTYHRFYVFIPKIAFFFVSHPPWKYCDIVIVPTCFLLYLRPEAEKIMWFWVEKRGAAAFAKSGNG